jgi:hypothetical protein
MSVVLCYPYYLSLIYPVEKLDIRRHDTKEVNKGLSGIRSGSPCMEWSVWKRASNK